MVRSTATGLVVVSVALAAGCSGQGPQPPAPGRVGPPPAPSAASASPGFTPPPLRVPAVTAARRIATTFFSLDYRDIDRYVDGVQGVSTGSFREDFLAKKQELTSTVTNARSSAHSTVLAAGARDETSEGAYVLLSVDQYVTTPTAAPKTLRSRVRMHLVPEGPSSWLMDELEAIVDQEDSACVDDQAPPYGGEALHAACTAVPALFTVDNDVDPEDRRADVAAVTTGAFQDEAVRILDDPRVRTSRAEVVPRIADAALVEAHEDRAVVLVFFNQAVTVSGAPARLDRVRATLEMTHEGDRWLVSGLQAL